MRSASSSIVRRPFLGTIVLALALATGACSNSSDESINASPTEDSASADVADVPSETLPSEETMAPEVADEPSTEAPAQAAGGPAVIDVAVQPGTADDGFEGARSDVSDFACARAGDGWQVSGTVVNSSSQTADYRIYVALLDSENDTRGLLQVDVDGVEGGGERTWEDELDLPDPELNCVLRVERVTG